MQRGNEAEIPPIILERNIEPEYLDQIETPVFKCSTKIPQNSTL